MGILIVQGMLTVGAVCLLLVCVGAFSAHPLVAGVGVTGVLLVTSVRFARKTFVSSVAGFEGKCIPVRASGDGIVRWQSSGQTGRYRQAHKLPGLPVVWLSGPEFSGYARDERIVGVERPLGLRRC